MEVQVPKNSSADKAPRDASGHRCVIADEEADAAALFWRGVSLSVLAAVDPRVPHHLDGMEG